MKNELQKAWYAIEHLHRVNNTEQVRLTYKSCSKIMDDYNLSLLQNKKFFTALQSITVSFEYSQLEDMQKVILDKLIHECRLAGAQLNKDDQNRLNQFMTKLRDLNAKFLDNVNDATNDWIFHTNDINVLNGLNHETICLAAEQAKMRDKTGWMLTIDLHAMKIQ